MSTVLDVRIRPTRPGVGRVTGRRPTWLRLAFVILPVMAVLAVQAANISGFPAANDDEGTYLAQAWAVQHGHGLSPYTYWYDHPPLGWLQIALMSWLPGLFASSTHTLVASLRVVMLPVTAASCILLYVLARRLGLPRWAGSLAVLLFGLSPLSVGLQREVLLDNFAVLWVLVAMVLCTSRRRDLWQHTAAGVALAVAVLSKETMIVVVPAVALLLWQHSHPTTRKFSLAGAVSGFTLTALLYPLYALLKNELLPGPGHVSLLGGLKFQMTRQGSGSLLSPTSASRQIFDSWLYYDRVLLLGGVVAGVLLLAHRPMRPIALAVVLFALTAIRPGYLPSMFVIQVLPFLALSLAAVADRVVRLVDRTAARVARMLPLVPRWPLSLASVAVVGVLAFGYTVPRWFDGDRTAVTFNANASYNQAAQWLRAHIADPARAQVVVDDVLWMDLVRDGLRPGLGAIWFYKMDLDPAVKGLLPHGWQDIDYIVSTPTMRQPSNSQLHNVHTALEHSTVVASFGSGTSLIEIRRIATSHAVEKP